MSVEAATMSIGQSNPLDRRSAGGIAATGQIVSSPTAQATSGSSGISQAEREFCRLGALENCRVDGRRRNDFRPIQVGTSIVPRALGSARVKNEETDIICSVTADLVTPSLETPNEGRIFVSVQIGSPALADQQLHPFGLDAATLQVRLGEALIEGPLNPSFVPRQSLVVVPKRFAWNVNVDVLVISLGGSVFDVASMALLAALKTTLFPKIKIVLQEELGIDEEFEAEAGDEGVEYADDEKAEDGTIPIGGVISRGLGLDEGDVQPTDPGGIQPAPAPSLQTELIHRTKQLAFQIDDRIGVGSVFPNISDIPLIVTAGKVDSFFLFDLTHEEIVSCDLTFRGLVNSAGELLGLTATNTTVAQISSVVPLICQMGQEVKRHLEAAIDRSVEEAKRRHGLYSWCDDLDTA